MRLRWTSAPHFNTCLPVNLLHVSTASNRLSVLISGYTTGVPMAGIPETLMRPIPVVEIGSGFGFAMPSLALVIVVISVPWTLVR